MPEPFEATDYLYCFKYMYSYSVQIKLHQGSNSQPFPVSAPFNTNNRHYFQSDSLQPAIYTLHSHTHRMLHWLSFYYQNEYTSLALHVLPALVNMLHIQYPTTCNKNRFLTLSK